MIEQRNVSGGYACSFDRDGGRFTFDVSLHGMAANNNAVARILDDLGVSKRLELVALSEIYHLITPALDISLPQRNPDAYAELIGTFFPSEKEGIQSFIKAVVAVAEEADKLHRNGMPPKIFFPVYGSFASPDMSRGNLMKPTTGPVGRKPITGKRKCGHGF